MTKVLIIDDQIKDSSPQVVRLREHFEVEVVSEPDTAISVIEEGKANGLIIILDLDLGSGVINGHALLNKIREISFLIPVIIWSAADETKETFSDLINNKSFAFIKQTNEEGLINAVFEAENQLKKNVDVALENWLTSQPEKDSPYLITSNGNQYSINDLIKEIRNRTEIGIKIENDILRLTIDLLSREKKTI
jgi:DNA-binding NtrC family response regulator